MKRLALSLLLTLPVLADAPPKLKVPPGFKVEVFVEGVKNARSMALAPSGLLFVGTRKEDTVYVVDTKTRKVRVVADNLSTPNGVAVKDGHLYVAEIGRILVYRDIEKQLANKSLPKFEVVTEAYPKDGHHGWKFIRFGPDGHLYVPVGAPCNVCDEPAPFATITRLDIAKKTFSVVASGVRNTVGFDWDAKGQLWFTENGRDLMGDEVPPCEINRLDKVGQHFGFPYCHGASVADPKFGRTRKCSDFAPPRYELRAHVAPLGMRFYTGKSFPAKYRGGAFFAEHGSWNRSKKIGYRVQFFTENSAPEVFLEGFLDGEKALGRPVDIENLPDGSILVSDDDGDRIWRVSHP